MREMKHSGSPTVGYIPTNWDFGKVKHYYDFQTGFTPDTHNDNYYASDDDGYDWMTIGDMDSSQKIPAHTTTQISEAYIKKYRPKITPSGSLLYSFKLSVGQVAFADRDIYTNEAIASFLPSENNNLKFLKYSSYMIEDNANENIYGAKILNQDLIRNAYIVFPPLEEQAAIVDFLDKKCSLINEAISRQKEAIEKLEEYKRATIIHKVSHTDTSAEYIPSGIPWMPKMPSTWEILPLKYAVTQRVNKNVGMQEKNLLTLSYGEIKRKNIETNEGLLPKSFEGYNIIEKGDIVLRLLDLQNDTHSLRTGLVRERGIITSAYVTITPSSVFDSMYCRYLLHAYDLMKVLYTMGEGVRQSLSFNELSRKILIPVPPIEEQRKIAEDISTMESNVNEAINRMLQNIEKLEEYKKSLIYNAVTGKIDCRN